MNAGSLFNKQTTAPIVNGGSYTRTAQDGTVVEGLMAGVNRYKDKQGREMVDGQLYTFNRGNIPQQVREGTESFAGWELVTAPSKSAADYAKQAVAPSKATAKGKQKADAQPAA